MKAFRPLHRFKESRYCAATSSWGVAGSWKIGKNKAGVAKCGEPYVSDDLLVSILGHLDDVSALGRAACVGRAWRDAAQAEHVWERAFQMVPLLPQLAEQPWYELTPRQALRQYVALSKSAADRLAIRSGPASKLNTSTQSTQLRAFLTAACWQRRQFS